MTDSECSASETPAPIHPDILESARSWLADAAHADGVEERFNEVADRFGMNSPEMKAAANEPQVGLWSEWKRNNEHRAREIIPAMTSEVERLRAEVSQLKAELEWRDASRNRGAALVSQQFAEIRSALGDVEQDVPNWDGNPIGLTAAVGNKVKRLEAENERLLLERDAAIYREIYPSNDDVSWLVLDGAAYHGERCGPFPSQVAAFDSVLAWVKYGLDPANEPMPEVVDYEEDHIP